MARERVVKSRGASPFGTEIRFRYWRRWAGIDHYSHFHTFGAKYWRCFDYLLYGVAFEVAGLDVYLDYSLLEVSNETRGA